MPVREFELFHGAVLTKLARSQRPLTLCMIETQPAEAWSTYRVNDNTPLLIKHSLNPRAGRKGGQACRTWQFVFSPNQMRQLQASDGICAALVCGAKAVGGTEMEVCLLDHDQVKALLDLSSTSQQSITVRRFPGKNLRASSARVDDDLLVPRGRLDKWAP